MNVPQKYTKRPVTIEAMQWFSSRGAWTAMEPLRWVSSEGGKYRIADDGALYIVTLEGEMRVQNRDFIIKGVQGEFYPCKPDIFTATYDVAKEEK